MAFMEIPDVWTCGSQGPGCATCRSAPEQAEVGKHLMVLNHDFHTGHYSVFPKFRNAKWTFSDSECLEVQIKTQAGTRWRGANPVLFLRDRDGGMVRIRPADCTALLEKTVGQWTTVRFPAYETDGWEHFYWMDGSLKHVDWFEVSFFGGGRYVWFLDGREVDQGTIQVLRPRGKADCAWQWAWNPADHHMTETGCDLHDNPAGPIHVAGFNSASLIIGRKDGVEHHGFITVPAFNFSYAAGNTEYAELRVTAKIKSHKKKYFAPPLPEKFYGAKSGRFPPARGNSVISPDGSYVMTTEMTPWKAPSIVETSSG